MLDLLDEIGTPDLVDAVMLRDVARRLGGDLVELAQHVEARVIELLDQLKPDRQLRTNVEFYAGLVMERCGVPHSTLTRRSVGPPPPQPLPAV
jgi:hypothetical protein